MIVGAGQVSRHREAGAEYRHPASLAAEALRLAGEDTGTGDRLLRRADSIRALASTCHSFRDLAALLAAEVGAEPRETVQTVPFGGNGPQLLVNDTAEAIAAGELEVALIAGAEAFASLRAAHDANEDPGWPAEPDGPPPTRIIGTDRVPVSDREAAAGLAAPVHVYALLETALRAAAGRDAPSHLERIAALWSRFSEVAAANPHAWLPRLHSAEEIATPTPVNRIVSTPYTKLLTANIYVDQAAALVLCSAAAARGSGVPEERWVFPWAGAEAHEQWLVSERPELGASPALGAAGRAALEHARVAIDDLAHVDVYSCFPVAVEIAAAELGLPLDDPSRPLTVTGGLTFAGGPGNGYSTHAIATLTRRLRDEPEALGLASAVGWYMTKHAVGVYSGEPPPRPFRRIAAGPEDGARAANADYTGPATLEAYTVAHNRDRSPEAAIVSALAPDGVRAIVRSTDEDVRAALLESDPLGAELEITGPGALTIGGG